MGFELDRSGSNSGEVARSQVNSGELFNDRKTETGRKKPMNYEEWSKSRELTRTLTSNFSVAC